jgi:hypothetical protein
VGDVEQSGWRLKVYGIAYQGEYPRARLIEKAKELESERLPLLAGTEGCYGVGFLGVRDGRGADVVFIDWWAEENELHHHVYVASHSQPVILFQEGDDIVFSMASTHQGEPVSWGKTVGCAPLLLEFVNQRVLQLIECREHGIGEVLAQMPEDLLGRVQFGTVAWQIERMHVRRPLDLSTVMTTRTVEHDPNRTLTQLVAQMSQKELQALAIHARQQQENASARGRFHCRIQPQPLILVLHNPGWTFPPSDTSVVAAR